MAKKLANVTVFNIDQVENGKAAILLGWKNVYINRLAENVYEVLDENEKLIEKFDKGDKALLRIQYI
jgi:hypothetical protein